MELAILIISWLLIAVGILGCFIHKFPGPIVAFAGMLLFIFGLGVEPKPWLGIAICAVLLIIAAICNKKVIPYITTKISEYSSNAKWGAVLGSLIGLLCLAAAHESTSQIIIVLILAFVILPFGFAYLFEGMKRKNFAAALKPATAAYLTYLLSMLLKLSVCAYGIYVILTNGKG